MKSPDMQKVERFVAENIGAFHSRRLEKLANMQINDVLIRRNPYLYKAKNLEVAHDIVKTMYDDYLTQQERTLFGVFLENLAVFVGGAICGGRKSGTEGIDLEFVRDGVHHLVSVKSGPNWGNSSQVKKQSENFRKAARVIRQNDKTINVRAVLGCCFGRDNNPHKDSFDKYCGQVFWEFLSGDGDLYLNIVRPLGHEAKKRNDEFNANYAKLLNTATANFVKRFCREDGAIDWDKLVSFNSREKKPE